MDFTDLGGIDGDAAAETGKLKDIGGAGTRHLEGNDGDGAAEPGMLRIAGRGSARRLQGERSLTMWVDAAGVTVCTDSSVRCGGATWKPVVTGADVRVASRPRTFDPAPLSLTARQRRTGVLQAVSRSFRRMGVRSRRTRLNTMGVEQPFWLEGFNCLDELLRNKDVAA